MTKVLVVDDEADLELLVRQKFRKKIASGEYGFSFALNGELALEVLAADEEIQIIVSDINMPVMDGLMLLSRIRELKRLTRFVIVSAYDDLRNIRTAMNRGAFDFLTKPIDFADLETTIAKASEELGAMAAGVRAQEQLRLLDYELQVATKIQQSILPETLGSHSAFEISATMLPAQQVGGDFFDFFLIDSNTLGIAIGDVSGKGIPAALYMAVSRTLLRATGLQTRSPSECLEQVNRVLLKQSSGELFVTLFYGVLDLATGALQYARAAHNPPYLLPREMSVENPARVLRDPGGMMAGMFDEAEYESGFAELRAGDTLVLFTDGIVEAQNGSGEFFGNARLTAVLEELHGVEPEALVMSTVKAVQGFVGNLPQSDDLTVMALRWVAPLAMKPE